MYILMCVCMLDCVYLYWYIGVLCACVFVYGLYMCVQLCVCVSICLYVYVCVHMSVLYVCWASVCACVLYQYG